MLSESLVRLFLLFLHHVASFMLDPAALLNKSEWLASVFSHTCPCSSPSPSPPPPTLSPSHAQLQKNQPPTVDSAHVQGLIWAVVPWWRSTVRLARGACRHEPCQRAFKEPKHRKRKQMEAGITPTHAVHLFPPCTPSHSSYSTSVQKTSAGFEVEECLNAGLVHAASDHKVPADSCATHCPFHKHIHKQASTTHVYDLLCSIVVVLQTSDWQLTKMWGRQEPQPKPRKQWQQQIGDLEMELFWWNHLMTTENFPLNTAFIFSFENSDSFILDLTWLPPS